MIIREGTLAEAVEVLHKIDELAQKESLDALKKRIGDKPHWYWWRTWTVSFAA